MLAMRATRATRDDPHARCGRCGMRAMRAMRAQALQRSPRRATSRKRGEVRAQGSVQRSVGSRARAEGGAERNALCCTHFVDAIFHASSARARLPALATARRRQNGHCEASGQEPSALAISTVKDALRADTEAEDQRGNAERWRA